MASLKRTLIYLFVLLLAAAVLFVRDFATKEGGGADDPGTTDVARAYAEHLSDVMMEVEAAVDRVLPDDDEGRRHQRFILRLDGGHTVLVAHNIDLAPRVPLRAGDRVRVRGEYEWNERGGVLHWTHHDPDGRHDPGWIEHDGQRYQ